MAKFRKRPIIIEAYLRLHLSAQLLLMAAQIWFAPRDGQSRRDMM